MQALLSYRVGRVAVAGGAAYAITELWPELLHEPDGTLKFPGMLEQNTVVMMSMFSAWKWWSADMVPNLFQAATFRAATGIPVDGASFGDVLL